MNNECKCKRLKETVGVELLNSFNMRVLIEETPDKRYKLVSISPNSGGLKDQGSIYITHCPLCGDRL